MTFAHVLHQTKEGSEFIRLSRAGANDRWRAVAVPVPGGSKAQSVNLALKVDNMPFFNNLAKSVRQRPTTFNLTTDDRTTKVTSTFVSATGMVKYVDTNGTTILFSPSGDGEEPESQASVGAVAFVAAVAILAIAAMVIAHEGGVFKGEASGDGQGGTVTVEASGGDGEEGGGEEGGGEEGGGEEGGGEEGGGEEGGGEEGGN